jgi:hypothetical protein
MSDKTPDENRDTDLRSKRNNGYGKTPSDNQQQLDWAHQALAKKTAAKASKTKIIRAAIELEPKTNYCQCHQCDCWPINYPMDVTSRKQLLV